jgi:hypothetical protein
MAPLVPLTPAGHETGRDDTQHADGVPRAWDETPPRCGATLDGVKRPTGMLVPRVRQAPDGGQSGGTNPRIAAGSTVVCDGLRLFSCTKVQKPPEDLKKLPPTLDIGSHINAGAQPLLVAAAT